jgi:hypothetical protein
MASLAPITSPSQIAPIIDFFNRIAPIAVVRAVVQYASMTVARTAPIDWLIAVAASTAIIYSFAFCIGIWGFGFALEAFGNSAFMVFIGYAGIPISLLSYSNAPELVPIFVGLVSVWCLTSWSAKRYRIGRSIKIAISTACLLSFWAFGTIGIVATQTI